MQISSPSKRLPRVAAIACILAAATVGAAAAGATPSPLETSSIPGPVFNRAPLAKKPYAELPLGAVQPRAWLADELRRMAEGMAGHLDAWYPEVVGDRNGWLGGDGDAWERGPYWIDGLYPLAILRKDEALQAKARRWIEWTLAHQREDGYIGPRPTAKPPAPEPGLQRDKQEDWWPRMPMLKVLQQYYQVSGDARVLDCLRRYFRHQLAQLPTNPLGKWTFWGVQRGADNALVVLWLYNLTGESWLLDLARLVQKQTLPYTELFHEGRLIHQQRGTLPNPGQPFDAFHCVNLAQGFKAPLVFSQFDPSRDPLGASRRARRDLMTSHGQPHGLFGGDEGLHGRDHDRGSEFCSAVEMMYSLETMIEISGGTEWADWLEQIAYNPLPTQATDDHRGKQYYQQANQVQVTRALRDFNVNHNGTDIVYGVLSGYPCCTTNYHQGWPKFVQHLWYAAADGGLAALAYGPCSVRLTIGGVEVFVEEETDYPFGDAVRFKVTTSAPVAFPLHLRVPGWCAEAVVRVNEGEALRPSKGDVHVIRREWRTGDRVELRLPMALRVTRGHERAATVERGPLVFALRVEESWSEVNPEDRRHGYRECRPTTPWNYALLESALRQPASGFEVRRADGPLPANPWTLQSAPLELLTGGVRLPDWTLYRESAGRVPMSPQSMPEGAKTERIRLIPYGCTTLRISAFPVVRDTGIRR